MIIIEIFLCDRCDHFPTNFVLGIFGGDGLMGLGRKLPSIESVTVENENIVQVDTCDYISVVSILFVI